MDWSNERYVRIYTRDTADDLVLSWQAMGLWPLIVRKADRSGVIATAHGPRGLAALVRWPLEVVIPAIAELLEDGRIVESVDPRGYVIPNYVSAQEAPQSDAQRQRESRERRRDVATNSVTKRDEKSRAVTPRHAESHDVTPSLAVPSDPSLAVPSLPSCSPVGDEGILGGFSVTHDDTTGTEPEWWGNPKPKEQPKAKRGTTLPDGWSPSAKHHALARELGVSCTAQVDQFRDHHTAKGTVFKDWDAAFRTWLRNAKSFGRAPAASAGPGGVLERQLEKVRRLEAEEARKAGGL